MLAALLKSSRRRRQVDANYLVAVSYFDGVAGDDVLVQYYRYFVQCGACLGYSP